MPAQRIERGELIYLAGKVHRVFPDWEVFKLRVFRPQVPRAGSLKFRFRSVMKKWRAWMTRWRSAQK